MNLYFLSGLGADKRVFQKLVLPEEFIIHHIEWVTPMPGASLRDYAAGLLGQIDTSRPFILAGLSFGGIMAIELARLFRPVQTVLISSISGPDELPPGLLLAGKWKLQRFIPRSVLLKPSRLLLRLFGTENDEQKQLLRRILADTDPVFFRWALDQMTGWNNQWKPPDLLHIHGTADRILPYRKNMNAIRVIGAGHLMVFTHSAIVSELLSTHLRRTAAE